MSESMPCQHFNSYPFIILPLSYVEDEMDEAEEEEELHTEIEVEQAPPVVPIPAPVEPPVKRKRGRPPKNKPYSKCQSYNDDFEHLLVVFSVPYKVDLMPANGLIV